MICRLDRSPLAKYKPGPCCYCVRSDRGECVMVCVTTCPSVSTESQIACSVSTCVPGTLPVGAGGKQSQASTL